MLLDCEIKCKSNARFYFLQIFTENYQGQEVGEKKREAVDFIFNLQFKY